MPLHVEFTEVKSSNLKAIGFAGGFGLFIDFNNGRRYRYPDGTEEIRDALVAESRRKDGSVGRKFKELVKDAGLAYEEVFEETAL